jgi:hypothetical protein
MTNQEWEGRMNELRDAQLVTQRLMELNERRWNERFEEMHAGLHVLVSRVDRHDVEIAEFRSGMLEFSSGMLELRAAMASLVEHIDRFIQGRQSNGQ